MREPRYLISPRFAAGVYCLGILLPAGRTAAAPQWDQLPPDLRQKTQAFHRDFQDRDTAKVLRYLVPTFRADLNGTRYSSRDQAAKDLPQYFDTSPDLKLTIDTLTVLSRGTARFVVRFGGNIRYVKDVPPDIGTVDETWVKSDSGGWMLSEIVFRVAGSK